MRCWPLVAVFSIGIAQGALAQSPTSTPSVTLDCTAFTKAIDEAALVKRFGRENVVNTKIDGAEGVSVRGTVVFPKDPTRRLEVYWYDEAKRRRLATIAVRGTSEWMVRTPGKARSAIGLKTSIDDIEEANERPFLINGFGWDYGGYGAGWKGGKLDNIEGGCSIAVRFNPDPKAQGKALDKVSGENQFGSSDRGIRAVKPFLSSITLDWPE